MPDKRTTQFDSKMTKKSLTYDEFKLEHCVIFAEILLCLISSSSVAQIYLGTSTWYGHLVMLAQPTSPYTSKAPRVTKSSEGIFVASVYHYHIRKNLAPRPRLSKVATTNNSVYFLIKGKCKYTTRFMFYINLDVILQLYIVIYLEVKRNIYWTTGHRARD